MDSATHPALFDVLCCVLLSDLIGACHRCFDPTKPKGARMFFVLRGRSLTCVPKPFCLLPDDVHTNAREFSHAMYADASTRSRWRTQGVAWSLFLAQPCGESSSFRRLQGQQGQRRDMKFRKQPYMVGHVCSVLRLAFDAFRVCARGPLPQRTISLSGKTYRVGPGFTTRDAKGHWCDASVLSRASCLPHAHLA
eukprot:590012-Rhodomonas_salina.1